MDQQQQQAGSLSPLRLDLLEALAHEIRTPMTTIYGTAKVLGRRGKDLSAAQRTDMLGAVELEADRLYRLLEDFFALAGAADALRTVREPVLVQHLVREIVRDLAPALGTRRIHASLPPGLAPVAGDADAITHAARNLIENAVHASPARGVVEIVVRQGFSTVHVHVYDSGPQLEAAGRAFEPFEQPAGDRPPTPGRALALAATRALVEAMGGSTWATQRPDGGTETGFQLPLFGRQRPRARTRRRHEARRPFRVLRRRAGRGSAGRATTARARQT